MEDSILVIEDEPDIAEIVRYNLEQAGFEVTVTEDGETGLALAREDPPALVVLDLMLPGMDGLDVCKILKQDAATRDVPVLMLTARKDEVDRIVGLELGADDYVVKPFSPREFVLRVRAILRRTQRDGDADDGDAERVQVGPITMHRAAHRILLHGQPVDLTATEFRLLLTLIDRRGRVQSRDDLLNAVWGYDYSGWPHGDAAVQAVAGGASHAGTHPQGRLGRAGAGACAGGVADLWRVPVCHPANL